MTVIVNKFGLLFGRRTINDAFFVVGMLGVGYVTSWNLAAMAWAFVASVHFTVSRDDKGLSPSVGEAGSAEAVPTDSERKA